MSHGIMPLLMTSDNFMLKTTLLPVAEQLQIFAKLPKLQNTTTQCAS
jgi:hypothetical protein